MKIKGKFRESRSYPAEPNVTRSIIRAQFSFEPETVDDIKFLAFLNDPYGRIERPIKKGTKLFSSAGSGDYTYAPKNIFPHLIKILLFHLPKKYFGLIPKRHKALISKQ